MRGNPDNLRLAAARKSAAATTRAEQGLRELIRTGRPITFRGLAQTAGVSLDFLYRTTQIRERVEQLRSQQRTTPRCRRNLRGPPKQRDPHTHRPTRRTTTPSPRRSEHPPARLEAAHGENLELAVAWETSTRQH